MLLIYISQNLLFLDKDRIIRRERGKSKVYSIETAK